MALQTLINDLQRLVSAKALNQEKILNAANSLNNMGFRYNNDQYPALRDTTTFQASQGETPENLAEALLWKMGKWKVYTQFRSDYRNETMTQLPKKRVVFFAFARHLRNPSNPIYDQHALRALWAIYPLSDTEKGYCKSVLVRQNGQWKTSGGGQHAAACYELYVKYVTALTTDSGPNLTELDRLLMPLGQAIKELTETYADFKRLCGWDQA